MTRAIVVAVALLFLFGGIAGAAAEELNPPSHTAHLFAFMALAVLGALMLPAVGDVMIVAAKKALGVAGPYIPSFGRRDYDNPPPAPPKDGGAP